MAQDISKKDPFILFSMVNMKLRDEGYNLEEYCKINEIDQKELEEKLASIGFTYDKEQNQFK